MKKSDMQPDFSVIIPVFNGEAFIQEALESVFADTWKSFEVIVVDDGSSDGTASLVKEFHDVRYHFQHNQGVAVARNTGIGLARGRYIAFLDSDDIWLPGRFEHSFRMLEEDTQVQYLLGDMLIFLEKGVERPSRIMPEWLEGPVPGAATCVLTARRECFEKVGLFNAAYLRGEDTEWLFRANEMKVKKAHVAQPVIRRRIHPGGLTASAPSGTNRENVFKMIRAGLHRKKDQQK
jgi:glycosyltransferase involved in cell wall biosynthesis